MFLEKRHWAGQSSKFNFGVASLAKRYEVAQIICCLVIAVEISVWNDVMHVKGFAFTWLLFALAYLASMPIALQCLTTLTAPIRPAIWNTASAIVRIACPAHTLRGSVSRAFPRAISTIPFVDEKSLNGIGFPAPIASFGCVAVWYALCRIRALATAILCLAIRPSLKLFTTLLALTAITFSWVGMTVFHVLIGTFFGAVFSYLQRLKRGCKFLSTSHTSHCFVVCRNVALVRAVNLVWVLFVEKTCAARRACFLSVVSAWNARGRAVYLVGMFRIAKCLAASWTSLLNRGHSILVHANSYAVCSQGGTSATSSLIRLGYTSIIPHNGGL